MHLGYGNKLYLMHKMWKNKKKRKRHLVLSQTSMKTFGLCQKISDTGNTAKTQLLDQLLV